MKYKNFTIYTIACKRGQICSFILLLPFLKRLDDIFIAAALHRYWICSKIKDNLHELAFLYIVKHNKLHIVKSLSSLYKSSISDNLNYASGLGHLEIVKYLYSIGAKPSWLAIYDASSNSHLEVVKYLYNISDEFKVFAINNACNFGNLEMMKFLYYNDNGIYYGYQNNDICSREDLLYGIEPFDDATYINAIKNNHLHIVEFLYQEGIKFGNDALEWIGEKGRLDVFQFLHGLGMIFTSSTLTSAIDYGQLKIIKYLHSIGVEYIGYSMYITSSFRYLEIVKFLNSIGIKFHISDIYHSIKSGNLDVVEFLHGIGSVEYTIDAVNLAFKYGHTEIAAYLAKNL